MLGLLELWSVIININLGLAGSSEPFENPFDDYTTHFHCAVGLAKMVLRFGLEKVQLLQPYTRASVVNALLSNFPCILTIIST